VCKNRAKPRILRLTEGFYMIKNRHFFNWFFTLQTGCKDNPNRNIKNPKKRFFFTKSVFFVQGDLSTKSQKWHKGLTGEGLNCDLSDFYERPEGDFI
jgi:hypothetical protein